MVENFQFQTISRHPDSPYTKYAERCSKKCFLGVRAGKRQHNCYFFATSISGPYDSLAGGTSLKIQNSQRLVKFLNSLLTSGSRLKLQFYAQQLQHNLSITRKWYPLLVHGSQKNAMRAFLQVQGESIICIIMGNRKFKIRIYHLLRNKLSQSAN